MTEIRENLKTILERNRLISAVMPAAFVFPLLYPLLNLINAIVYIRPYNVVSSLFYLVYLFGLIICFAKSSDWAMGIAFALNAIRFLIILIQGARFNYVIYLLFYLALACICLRRYVMPLITGTTEQNKTETASTAAQEPQSQDVHASSQEAYPPPAADTSQQNTSAAGVPDTVFCMNCGHAISRTSKFCTNCGTPNTMYIPQQAPSFSSTYAQNQAAKAPGGISKTAADLCGGIIALVFSALLTLQLIFVFANSNSAFSVLLSALWNVPTILMCIGCWVVFVTVYQKSSRTSGFTLLRVGMVIAEVVYIVLAGIGCLLGIIMMSNGGRWNILFGLLIAVGFGACILLAVLYWGRLRKTTQLTKQALAGGTAVRQKVLLPQVILVIRAALSLLVLLITSMISRFISDFFSGLISSLSVFPSGPLDNLLSSFLSSISSFLQASGTATLRRLCAIAVAIFAIAILYMIQAKGKEDRTT